MKKNVFFSLLLLLIGFTAGAQNLTAVSGTVIKLADGTPVPDQWVVCWAGDSINPVFGEGITDASGAYLINLDVPPAVSQLYVYTYTACDPSGGTDIVVADIVNGAAHADFQVCEDSFPPFVDSFCFGDIVIIPLDSLSFQFEGVYYGADPTDVGVSWFWDFGDGSTSTDASPVHTYAAPGFYWVTLAITGADGCTAYLQYPIDTEFNGFPECMGYILYTQTGTTEFDFSAEAYNADGTLAQIVSYDWDFGDGNTSTDASPSHTYAEEGVYTVQLHAVTEAGCEIHSCNVVFAYDCPIDTFWYGCQAMFYVGTIWDSFPPNPAQDPNTLQFIDASLGAVATWSWDFGDGSTSTEQNPEHTYAEDGVYTVTLAITTVDGCESEASFDICIGDDCWGVPEYDCQAMFIPLPDSIGGSGLQFIDLSFSPNPIQSWTWDFGDGSTSNEQNPYHVYDQPGVYTVTLTIEADSCNSVISFEIDTENPWGFVHEGDGGKLGLSSGASAVKDVVAFNDIKVMPNPVASELSVVFNSKKATGYELVVRDLSGRQMSRSMQEAGAGLNAARVNVAGLTPGFYLVELRSGEAMTTLKFVKQ